MNLVFPPNFLEVRVKVNPIPRELNEFSFQGILQPTTSTPLVPAEVMNLVFPPNFLDAGRGAGIGSRRPPGAAEEPVHQVCVCVFVCVCVYIYIYIYTYTYIYIYIYVYVYTYPYTYTLYTYMYIAGRHRVQTANVIYMYVVHIYIHYIYMYIYICVYIYIYIYISIYIAGIGFRRPPGAAEEPVHQVESSSKRIEYVYGIDTYIQYIYIDR